MCQLYYSTVSPGQPVIILSLRFLSMTVIINISVIYSRFINKFMQKCQCYYTLLDQSIPLVTVTSDVSLLTEQLWVQCHLLTLSDNLFNFLINNGGGIIDQWQGFSFLPLTGQLANTFWYIAVILIYVILFLKFPTVMTNQRRDYRKRFDLFR